MDWRQRDGVAEVRGTRVLMNRRTHWDGRGMRWTPMMRTKRRTLEGGSGGARFLIRMRPAEGVVS